MSIDAALNKLESMVRAMIEPISPFRATVTALSGGLVAILREDAASADTQLYARAAGWTLAVNDVVLCLKVAGQPFVLCKIQNSTAGTLGLDGGLIGEIVPDATQTNGSITANTTSTSTFSDCISRDTVLPAGTWTALPLFLARFQHSAAGSVDVRISVAGSSSGVTTAACGSTAPGSSMFKQTSITGIVSDGVTATTAAGQFRSNTAGTTTPTEPLILIQYRRTA